MDTGPVYCIVHLFTPRFLLVSIASTYGGIATVQWVDLGQSLSGMRLSAWQMIAASCLTALGALCGQLTCVVPWTLGSYGDRTFAAAGSRFGNSLPVQLHNPDITYRLFGRRWRDTSFARKHEHGALWLLICSTLEKHLLTRWLVRYHGGLPAIIQYLTTPMHSKYTNTLPQNHNITSYSYKIVRFTQSP